MFSVKKLDSELLLKKSLMVLILCYTFPISSYAGFLDKCAKDIGKSISEQCHAASKSVSKQACGAGKNISKQSKAAIKNTSKQIHPKNISQQTHAGIKNISKHTAAGSKKMQEHTCAGAKNISKHAVAGSKKLQENSHAGINRLGKNVDSGVNKLVEHSKAGSKKLSEHCKAGAARVGENAVKIRKGDVHIDDLGNEICRDLSGVVNEIKKCGNDAKGEGGNLAKVAKKAGQDISKESKRAGKGLAQERENIGKQLMIAKKDFAREYHKVLHAAGIHVDLSKNPLIKQLFKEVDNLSHLPPSQQRLLVSLVVVAVANYFLPGLGGTVAKMALDLMYEGKLQAPEVYARSLAADLITQGVGDGVEGMKLLSDNEVAKAMVKGSATTGSRVLFNAAATDGKVDGKQLLIDMTVASLSEGASSKISVEDSKFLERIAKNAASENVSIAVESGLKGEALDRQKLIKRNREALYTTVVNHGVDNHLKNELDAPKFNALEELYNKLDKTDQDEKTPHEELMAEVLTKGVGVEYGFNDEDSKDLIADIMEQIPSEFLESSERNENIEKEEVVEVPNQDSEFNVGELNTEPLKEAENPFSGDGPVEEGLGSVAFNPIEEGFDRAIEKTQDVLAIAGDNVVQHTCFPEGTLVLTPSGPVAIQQLNVGDEVYHCNTRLKKCEISHVLIKGQDYKPLLTIQSKDWELQTTFDHPFWVEDVNDYMEAQDLEPGLNLRDYDGNLVKIEKLKVPEDPEPELVYNIKVAEHPNFYVSASQNKPFVLVHNCDYAGEDSFLCSGSKVLNVGAQIVSGIAVTVVTKKAKKLPKVAKPAKLNKIKGVGDSNSKLPNRKQALNEAKDRAGVPRSQQPERQWEVGNDPKRRGMKNYKYDENPGAHGRYYEYKDAHGNKKVVAEHTNDPNRATKHVHAGEAKPKGDPKTYDFKEDRYKNIDTKGDQHIDYE